MNLLDDDALLDLGGRRRATTRRGPSTGQGPADAVAGGGDPTPGQGVEATGSGPRTAGTGHEAGAGPVRQDEDAATTGDACHMCQRRASRTCKSCERPVCAADSWVMFGLCRSCASEDRVKGWNAERRATGGNWLEEP